MPVKLKNKMANGEYPDKTSHLIWSYTVCISDGLFDILRGDDGWAFPRDELLKNPPQWQSKSSVSSQVKFIFLVQ